MLTSQDIQSMAKIIIDRFHPNQIYLFGSYAKNEQTEDSDVDFFVVVSADDLNLRELRRQIRSALADYDIDKDIIVASSETLEKLKNSKWYLYRQIINQGKIIYERAA